MHSNTELAPTECDTTSSIVHESDSPLAEVIRSCRRIAKSNATVLLSGETGTGKEVFARYIHQHSGHSSSPFVPVNCGAIPETLLESELFGHVRGAFTGALAARRGRVALAEGGTLFLDEIGELSLPLQVKLLRLLQERTYEPVGSAESVSANFRLVAATNRNLATEVEAGRFRRDLFYRLLVCPLELPPLRARRGDVRGLFQFFWLGRGETRAIDPLVFKHLESYPWPGNVRELENLVERVSVCTEGPSIRVNDLPSEFRQPPHNVISLVAETASLVSTPKEQVTPLTLPSHPGMRKLPINLPALLRELEDAYIGDALEQAGGSKKMAAELLGLQRTTLVEKLRRRVRDPSEG